MAHDVTRFKQGELARAVVYWASRPRQFKIQPRLGFGKDLRLRIQPAAGQYAFFANDRRRTEKGREFKVDPSFIFKM